MIADGPEVRVVAGRSGRYYRQNMKAGYIYRIGGSPTGGYSGDGGSALLARLSASTIGLDGFGNVVLGDSGNFPVRVIAARTGRFYGQKMTVGDIYTVDGDGNRISGDGGPPLAAEFGNPTGVAVSTAGGFAFVSSSTLNVVPPRSGTSAL